MASYTNMPNYDEMDLNLIHMKVRMFPVVIDSLVGLWLCHYGGLLNGTPTLKFLYTFLF